VRVIPAGCYAGPSDLAKCSTNGGYAETLLRRARKLARSGRNLKELEEYGMDSSGLEKNLLLGSCEHDH
jgi:hypothetical protein